MVPEELSIGPKLRTAREAAGLTPDDVHYRTRLPKAVIAALESEDFASFASPLYARSFLSQYSVYLNVDADRWLDALEPGHYVAGDSMGVLLDSPRDVAAWQAPAAAKSPSHGGWFATPLLMFCTAALVFVAMKGYEHFEEKSRSEESANGGAERTPDPAPAAAPPVDTEPPDAPPGEDEGDTPPRALIVR